MTRGYGNDTVMMYKPIYETNLNNQDGCFLTVKKKQNYRKNLYYNLKTKDKNREYIP